jgi:hypothetical protein
LLVGRWHQPQPGIEIHFSTTVLLSSYRHYGPLPAVYEDARVISRRADSPSFLDAWKVLQKNSVTLIGPGFPCRGNTINVANCNCEALFTGFLVPVTLAYWSIRISDGVVLIGTRCSRS